MRTEVYYKIEVQDGGRWQDFRGYEYREETWRDSIAVLRQEFPGYLFRPMKYTVTIEEVKE